MLVSNLPSEAPDAFLFTRRDRRASAITAGAAVKQERAESQCAVFTGVTLQDLWILKFVPATQRNSWINYKKRNKYTFSTSSSTVKLSSLTYINVYEADCPFCLV